MYSVSAQSTDVWTCPVGRTDVYDPVTLPPTQYKLSKDLSTESLVVLQNLKERLKDLHVCVNLGILQMFS